MMDYRIVNPVGQEQRSERFTEGGVAQFQDVQKPGKREFALAEYGYVADGDPVPIEYLARVTSIRNAATVVAPLQDDILLRVESRWEPLVPASLLATGNMAVQIATKGRRSLITKATTRRMWTGTSPMIMSLRMRFEAVSDPLKQVAEPCRILQSIALPSQPENGYAHPARTTFEKVQQVTIDKLPLLGPPGPTPFTIEGILNNRQPSSEFEDLTGLAEGLKGGDKIMVELGRFITFYNVVVREVSAAVPIKFDQHGNPISATVNMIFETYEMMTVEGLSDSFQKTVASKNNTGISRFPNT